jgi:hypothetical protein
MKTTPAADSKPDNTSTQVSLRGDRAVQPQSPATRRPVPAAPPVDDITDITPHERQMLEAMKIQLRTISVHSTEYVNLFIFQCIDTDVCLVAKKFEDAVNGGDVATQREICLSVGTVVRSSDFRISAAFLINSSSSAQNAASRV